jgi:hypothetical protein
MVTRSGRSPGEPWPVCWLHGAAFPPTGLYVSFRVDGDGNLAPLGTPGARTVHVCGECISRVAAEQRRRDEER